MAAIVLVDKYDTFTTSEILANGIGTEHRSVMKLIREHSEELEVFGTLTLGVRKTKGRPAEYAMLTEPQTTYLVTLMNNTENVVKFKMQLVKEFYRMRNVLSDVMSRQKNEDWKQIRSTGKMARVMETELIEKFVQYATNQGSTQAFRYYANISKMENKALFFLEQKFSNVRELLTGHQIGIMISADIIVEKALKDGMEQNMNYKDIYQMAKERIETFASVMPKTPVPMVEQKRLE